MQVTFTSASALSAVLALATAASAQSYVAPASQAATSSVEGFYTPGAYGQGYHASTFEEGVLTGYGNLLRSQGEANYLNSLAAINGQEAYSRYLKNREQRTETYFRMRQINRAARESERPERLSPEQYVVLAKRYAPSGLSQVQYDRTLGRLTWPALLAGEEFAAEREALDRAFLVRSPSDTGAASAFHANVRQLTGSLEAKLQAKIQSVSPAEYMAAKNFVNGLARESTQPLVMRAVASR